MEDVSREAAEFAILAYLSRYPRSADTLEGVHLVWIDWPGLPESMSVTQRALERLAAVGILECLQIPNRQLWRLRTESPADPAL